jgi:predicted RNA-binding Zn-ribbon protein involved in translation (DUF1610 family)
MDKQASIKASGIVSCPKCHRDIVAREEFGSGRISGEYYQRQYFCPYCGWVGWIDVLNFRSKRGANVSQSR